MTPPDPYRPARAPFELVFPATTASQGWEALDDEITIEIRGASCYIKSRREGQIRSG